MFCVGALLLSWLFCGGGCGCVCACVVYAAVVYVLFLLIVSLLGLWLLFVGNVGDGVGVAGDVVVVDVVFVVAVVVEVVVECVGEGVLLLMRLWLLEMLLW